MFKRVFEVDWSTEKYLRSSIVPYFKHENQYIFGFGITVKGNLTTFGGMFEKSDFDLLDTAQREYKEETGLSCNDKTLFGSFVIQTQGNIVILYKYDDIPPIKVSDELVSDVWLTIEQLKNIKQANIFSFDVSELVEIGLDDMDLNISLNEESETNSVPIRNKKVVIKDRFLYDVKEFEHDLTTNGNWQLIILIFQDGWVYLKRSDEKMYQVSKNKFVSLSHYFKEHRSRLVTLGKVPNLGSKIYQLWFDEKDESVNFFYKIYSTTKSPLYKLECLCQIEKRVYEQKKKKSTLGPKTNFFIQLGQLTKSLYTTEEINVEEKVIKWAIEFGILY